MGSNSCRQDGNDGERVGVILSTPAVSSPAPETRRDFVTELRHALLQVHDYLPELAGEVDALAQGRDQLNVIRSDLSALLRTIDTMVIEAAGHSRAKFKTGLGEVEVKQGLKRSEWQSEQLAKKLFTEALARGGIDEAWTVMCATLPLTGSLGWRVTPLKDLGVRVSDWCKEEKAALTVQWPKGES